MTWTIEDQRAANRRYMRSEKGRETAARYRRSPGFASVKAGQEERHRQKRLARKAIDNAVRRGRLVRGPCRDCGNSPTQAHHHRGYAVEQRLDVVWLCRFHHEREHGRLT